LPHIVQSRVDNGRTRRLDSFSRIDATTTIGHFGHRPFRISQYHYNNNGLLYIAAQCWIVYKTLKH